MQDHSMYAGEGWRGEKAIFTCAAGRDHVLAVQTPVAGRLAKQSLAFGAGSDAMDGCGACWHLPRDAHRM